MRILLVLLGIFTLVNCASPQGSKSNKEKAFLHLKIGSGYLVEGKYPQALKELLMAEKYEPKNSQIQNNLGIAYYVREKYQKAENHIRQALTINPKYTEARNNLGRTLIQLSLYDEAISQLKMATDDLTFKEPSKSWSNLGIAYFSKGEFEPALDSLRRSLEIKPTHCSTFTYYGRTLFELKQFDKASLALDQAVGICKKEAIVEAKYYGAISYYRLNQKRQAIARLEEIVSKEPTTAYWQKAQKLLNLINQ